MTLPAFSVVVPALNEERCIEEFLDRVSRFLEGRGSSWEIIVVDDGSSDATVARVEAWMRKDARVRLMTQPHRGKGAAIRQGMLAARGAWRFMADADLSVSPDDWTVFFDAAGSADAPDVIVGSREAPGARRIGEPFSRHLIGRAFNRAVQLLAVPGINDTQCGFKLFCAEAARTLFPQLTIDGLAFDVELLFLARRAGFRVREVGVVWVCRRDSRVRIGRGAAAFADILRIRFSHLRRPQRAAAIALAAPVCLLTVALIATLVTALYGRHPLWRVERYNLAEAVALRDEGEVARLIEAGQDATARYQVRAGVLFNRETRLTPLEAAIAGNDTQMTGRLLNSLVLDAALWNHLRCIADGDRMPALLDERRPEGAILQCEGVHAPWEVDEGS